MVGELSLDGTVKPIHCALPIAIRARQLGYTKILCPVANVKEMTIIEGIEVFPVANLKEAVEFLCGKLDLKPYKPVHNTASEIKEIGELLDMADIKGRIAKRALEISAAGGHNTLMIGCPAEKPCRETTADNIAANDNRRSFRDDYDLQCRWDGRPQESFTSGQAFSDTTSYRV